jgi:hypothetical protein
MVACVTIFFSNEGQQPEPPHIHIKDGRDAKIWLIRS